MITSAADGESRVCDLTLGFEGSCASISQTFSKSCAMWAWSRASGAAAGVYHWRVPGLAACTGAAARHPTAVSQGGASETGQIPPSRPARFDFESGAVADVEGLLEGLDLDAGGALAL
jgi:hypothetical protein